MSSGCTISQNLTTHHPRVQTPPTLGSLLNHSLVLVIANHISPVMGIKTP